MGDNKLLAIIDGNSLINRAYYAMQRPMVTKNGVYTQGIYGFLNMFSKIIQDRDPGYVVVCWDLKAPTFRHLEYGEYKAGRRKMPPELAMQIPLMKRVFSAMNVKQLELEGYEADDLIGTTARQAEEAGLEPLIITGDRDTLQLCTDKCHVLLTKKGISEFELYDADRMMEVYGLTPQRFIDLKGLMGDQSDNIPGIPGVGEKIGLKLLQQFGSVEELLANTDEIESEKLRTKVEENAQLAILSKRLATIDTCAPVDFVPEDAELKDPDLDALIDIYVELEFNSFLKKLGDRKRSDEPPAHEAERPDIRLARLRDAEGAEKLRKSLDALEEGGKKIGLKVFSDGSHVLKPAIYGISLLVSDVCYHAEGEAVDAVIDIMKGLAGRGFSFFGHELIEDYYVLMRHGFYPEKTCFDTAVAQYVIDPTRSNYDLAALMLEYFHEEMPKEQDLTGDGVQMDLLGGSDPKEGELGLSMLSAASRLMKVQEAYIAKASQKKLLQEVEFPLIEVLASMEADGFRTDRSTLDEFGKELTVEIESLTSEIYSLAGKEFNINSPKQLGDVLFDDLGLPSGKKTKTGWSTGAEVLEKIADKHPVVGLVLRYRTLSKLRSTYVEGLIPLIGDDRKIRPHFQQLVTATGRISCTEPNLQNIPVRNEYGRMLRKAFIPSEEDYILTGADYSQIELRVLAHLSGDPNLIDAFNRGADIHRDTASRVFGIPYDEVTSLDRSRAKAVNFGVIYGMSGFGLSEELHISRREAENYIKDYFAKHKPVKDYMDSQVSMAKEKGYTETIMGRRRAIKEISSPNYMVRSLGERLAMNSPIQGSAADIIKIAMIKVYKELKERDLRSRLILQVHDELIIDGPESEREAVSELLLRNMEEAQDLSVRLVSDLNTGKTWYELK